MGEEKEKWMIEKRKYACIVGEFVEWSFFTWLYLTEENGGYYDKFRLTFTFNMIEFYMGKFLVYIYLLVLVIYGRRENLQ